MSEGKRREEGVSEGKRREEIVSEGKRDSERETLKSRWAG